MRLFALDGYIPSMMDLIVHIIPGLIIYQIIGAIRHVASHAFMYHLGGYRIRDLRLYPHVYHRQFYWAYCRIEPYGGAKHSYAMELAPYLMGAISAIIWVFITFTWADAWSSSPAVSWHMKVMFAMLFLISPIVDTLLNLIKFMFRQGDFFKAYRHWKVYR
jgi:hypothetical protein